MTMLLSASRRPLNESRTGARTDRRGIRAVCVLILVLATTGCQGLLDVSNPTKIQESDLANSAGAHGEYATAVGSFHVGFNVAAASSSVFADERTFEQYQAPNPSYANRDINYDRHDGAV